MARRDRYHLDPDFSYANTFDRLMEEHFGEPFKTEWNLLAGSFGGYQTVRVSGKKVTKRMNEVGKSISDALAAGQGAFRRG